MAQLSKKIMGTHNQISFLRNLNSLKKLHEILPECLFEPFVLILHVHQ